jgi:hypothetical protein
MMNLKGRERKISQPNSRQYARISICQNLNMPESQYAKISICQNLNMPESQYAKISICQNLNMPEFQYARISICQNLNMPESQYARNAITQEILAIFRVQDGTPSAHLSNTQDTTELVGRGCGCNLWKSWKNKKDVSDLGVRLEIISNVTESNLSRNNATSWYIAKCHCGSTKLSGCWLVVARNVQALNYYYYYYYYYYYHYYYYFRA